MSIYEESGQMFAMFDDHDWLSRDGYCDYCEKYGHTFRTCSARDDVTSEGEAY